MKDYKEVAENVLQRGLEEVERERRRKKAWARGGCTVAALGLVAVVSVGALWGKNWRENGSAGQFVDLDDMEVADHGKHYGEGVENFGEDLEGQTGDFGMDGMADSQNPGGDGAFTGDVSGVDTLGTDGFGMDGGQGGFSEMDGDPAGYSPAPSGDAFGDLSGDEPMPGGDALGKLSSDDPTSGENTLGSPFGDEPVPNEKAPVLNGKAEEEKSEFNWESTGESLIEDSMPVVEDANLPNHGNSADGNKQLPSGAWASEVGTNSPKEPKETVSSYPEKSIYCYAAPSNGEFFCSVPLTHAMEEYGDDVLYRVVVKLFCDGNAVEPVSEKAKYEWERLADFGYKLVRKSYDDGERKWSYFMLHATKGQLEEFPASEEYGYMFRFSDEQ